MSKIKTPTIHQIYSENQIQKQKADDFKLLVNHQPKKEWIKQHPFAKNVQYLPIDKIEYLLDSLFIQWRVEIKSIVQLFNSVSVEVRLHVQLPSGDWTYHDGCGAVGIQTDSGASASDLSKIKQDAVMKALPAAKSYAIKDASEHFGNLFGRNLNRKDTLAFASIIDKKSKEDIELERLNQLLDACKTIAEVERLQESSGAYYDLAIFETKINQLKKSL